MDVERETPDREWFTLVDSVCSLVGNRRYGLTDDDLARQLREISADARRFVESVGDRYVGGFPITGDAMKAFLEAAGFRVFRPDDCEVGVLDTVPNVYDDGTYEWMWRHTDDDEAEFWLVPVPVMKEGNE